jgi:hypothetical protein
MYLNLISAEQFGATIDAFTYPEAFNQHDGLGSDPLDTPGLVIGQQVRKPFGLSYRTRFGNDTEGDDFAYKLHMLYGCLASPSEKAYNTVNDSPEAVTFSWDVTTTPVPVTGFRPTSLLVVDSSTADPTALAALEAELYGTITITANLPTPDEVITLLSPP